MKFTRHTQLVRSAYAYGPPAVSATGFTFELPDYPGVTWFVYGKPGGSWRCVESASGQSAGRTWAKTRRDAVANLQTNLANLTASERFKGDKSALVAWIKELSAKAGTPSLADSVVG